MTLLDLCKSMISSDIEALPLNHKMGTRLVCPEYSKYAQEVKTYPLLSNDRIFALCWHFNGSRILSSTMCPAPKAFCYHFHFDRDMKTQLHTHEYIELAYVVDGEFKQKILGKDIIFTKGDLCLIDKNCLHQDYLLNQPATILFLGIANDMFSEIMDENITTEKIISFLQSALMKQKDVQQYLHFKPGPEGSCELENCLYALLKELKEAGVGTYYIRKGLLLRIFRILSSKFEFALSKEQRNTMNWLIFEQIIDYIKQHFATITIQELCTVFNFQEDILTVS